MNAWISLLRETMELFGLSVPTNELYTKLYQHSLEGDADCGGVLVYNYLAGESVVHADAGRPIVVRRPNSSFTLANFLRSQLYSTMSTLKLGMDLLSREGIIIDSLTGHGGLFKTPIVGQRYLAAACGAPVTCMETAGEGGPYGMALLAAYMLGREKNESLEQYLAERVFADVQSVTVQPLAEDAAGFEEYISAFAAGLTVEKMAAQVF